MLDVADVVLVDAIGTGFSTASPRDKEKDYHHFSRDIDAFTEFIVTYLNRYGRWASPKYLAGESYGTTRGAAIAQELFNKQGVELNGIDPDLGGHQFPDHRHREGDQGVPSRERAPIPSPPPHLRRHRLVSRAALRGSSERGRSGSCSTRWRSSPSVEYGPLWPRVIGIDSADRAAVLDQLQRVHRSRSEDYLDRLRPADPHHAVLQGAAARSERRTVGRLDSRYTGIDRFADGDNLENDPSGDQMMGLFTSTLNEFLREELGYENESFYKSLSMKVNESWDYEEFKGHYVNTSDSSET